MHVTIGGRTVGDGAPPFVVAELSGNHNGSIDRALALVQAAARADVDALKLQTYTPDTMTIDCDRPDFLVADGPWRGRRLYELYSEAATPWEWHPALFRAGREAGIGVFSTPFDETAVEFLETLDPPAYKIASFEVLDHALIRRVAATGRPMVISTGMAVDDEIGAALDVARSAGAQEIALLHCVSAYPAPADEMNLRAIPRLRARFGVPVGLSDHTLGTEVATAATALGACLIEKHLTLRRADGGVDSTFSLEPDEFADLVRTTRTVFAALGTGSGVRAPSEEASVTFRRSLYIVRDVVAGDVLADEDVRAIRPGRGLPPHHRQEVVGRVAARDMPRGTPITWDCLR